eukprot:2755228-Rhodomonas_salina.1
MNRAAGSVALTANPRPALVNLNFRSLERNGTGAPDNPHTPGVWCVCPQARQAKHPSSQR